VLGLRQAPEAGALGVDLDRRGAEVDEVLPLLRRLWAGEVVDHEGPRWRFSGVAVEPRPLQSPLEPWLGGQAPAALRRCGRLADGWLPSLCTPAEAAAGREVVEAAAAEAGRTVDPEHFGMSIGYARTAIPAATARSLAARRPGLDPAEVVPVGVPALRRHLERLVDVGFSKFVVRPLEAPASWPAELEDLAGGVLDLQR
jgi:probable F420-dependent oxidoreductase